MAALRIRAEEIVVARKATDEALEAVLKAPPQDEDWRLEEFIVTSRKETDLIHRFNAQFEMTAGPDPRLVGRAKNA